MSDYSQITFFTPKDGLATGNPNKIIYGSDVDAELSAISTAIATKADVDGDAIGAGTPATELSVDNLKLDANKIISTNTDGDIELEPNGAGYVVITNADINAGNIDNTVIGATTAAAITGTTLTANTSLALASGATVTAILDEDNLVSDSATALATQQSIKAYVDAQVTAQDLDVTTDSGTIAIDLDSETLTVAGGTGLDTSATGNTVTVAIDSTVATLTGAQTLTNKVLTSPDINTPDIDGGTIDGATIATSDITVGAGKTLDVSAGTLTLANDQISGDKIQGGTIGSVTITTADINGGSLDGVTIGGSSAGAASFTTLTASGDVNFDSGTFFVDASADAVGIGTTSFNAANKLEVTGDINTTWASGASRFIGMRFADGSLYEMGLIVKESPELQVYAKHAAGAPITFLTGATPSERMRITSGGDISFYEDTGTTPKFFWDASAESLGIGTTAPGAKLDVVNSGVSQIQIQNTSGTTKNTQLMFADNVGSKWRIGMDVATNNNTNNFQLYNDVAASAALTVDSSGNVGIGTSSPATKLEVQRSGAGNVASFNDGTYGADIAATSTGGVLQTYNINQTLDFKVFNSGYMRFFEGSTERMRIDSSGQLGLGTSSPDTLMELRAANPILTIRDTETSTASNDARLRLAETGVSDALGNYYDIGYIQGNLQFRYNTSEYMRLDDSGNLLVGTTSVTNTSPSVQANPLGDFKVVNGFGNGVGENIFLNRQSGTGDFILFRYTNSTVGSISTNGSTTAYNTSSDARLKHDIVDAPDASGLIDAIKVRSFKWNADDSEQRYGMVAQELLEVAPEAVSGDPESEDMMGVDYSKLVPMLVKEIQSLRARVAQLEGA